MQEWPINKKLVIIFVILAALLATAVFGASYAASYYYKKGAQAYSQNNFPAAKNNFNNSLIFDSKNSRAHFWLGKISLGLPAPKQAVYYPQADYGEAVKHYEKTISLGLEQKNRNLYGVALDDLGNAYWNLNKLDKAREKYSEKLSKFPELSFWARYFIAFDDFNRLNKPEEALEILLPAQSLSISENDSSHIFQVYLIIARLYVYFDDYKNAVKYAKLSLESVTSENERAWEVQSAHLILAKDYGKEKKFSLALDEVKKANELNGSAGAYNCIIASFYLEGKNYSQAISTAEKAVKTDNDYVWSSCINVLAVSYLAKGDKINAKKYMEEYLNFTEKFSETNIFVARNRQQFEGELQKIK